MEVQYNGVKDKVLLMKVTSRGRPQQLIHCIKEYLRLASNPKAMVWLITLDHDDDKCNTVSFCDSLGHILDEPNIAFGHSNNKIHAINRDVNQLHIPHWDILLNISDDQLPIVQGYDSIIREAMPNNLYASLWFNDGSQDRINTQEIVGREYYNRDKHIYHPSFKSFYCDNYATLLAEKRHCLIKSNQCIIEHKHPACRKKDSLPQDALYDRNQKYWNEDEATFELLKREL
jgi:hypothetical protein